MKTRRSAPVALLALVAMLVASAGEIRASGGGPQATCESNNPSGAPISMNISVANVDVSAGTIGVVTIEAFFGNGDVGTFSAPDVHFSTIGDPVQAACDIFNGTTLGAQIFAAIGLNANFMMFTACSVLGPGSAVPDPCKAPVGTINTPIGWNATSVGGGTFSGNITGYAVRL